MNYKNYRSINKSNDPAGKKWAIAVKMQKTIQQANVKLNSGKSFQYACRYPVTEGDVAVIGNALPYQPGRQVLPSSSTGNMGIATDVRPKLEINRSHATELDYVFTPAVSKKTISECTKYLELPGNDITLQFGKLDIVDTIYPIAFLIRKLLAAASIIAFPQYADAEAIEKAKSYICRPQIIDKDMGELNIGMPDLLVDINLCDIQVDVDGKNEAELNNLNLNYIEDGIINGFDRNSSRIVPAVNEYVNKYAYIGAISVMVRGGFVNLLQAFLSANPPIKIFYDELLNAIGQIGNAKALETLKGFIPV